MKKFLLGTVALIAFAAPAAAADLAARPYTKAPAMIPAIYDWTGFYIGANGGWGNSHATWTNTVGVPTGEGSHDADGGTAGGQIGYRWQTGQWVFGVEGQGNWADFRGSNPSLLIPGLTNRSKIDAFGLITGQIGYAWNNALIYVKGGAAVTGNRYEGRVTATGDVFDRVDNTRWGATVGAGLEYGFAPNWSIGVEYDHMFMGTETYTLTSQPAPGTPTRFDSIKQDADLVTVRVNYRWGGPVIAKY